MEALYQDLIRLHDSPVSVLNVDLPYFLVPWHYHPEVEIILITEGEGVRFVGDHIDNYEIGDLVVVGSNLPHVWRSSSRHYEEQSDQRAKCRVIHFIRETFGTQFWNLPAMNDLNRFLDRAAMGIHIKGSTAQWAEKIIFKMESQSPFERILSLLKLLQGFESTGDRETLSSVMVAEQLDQTDGLRFSKVLEYIAMNFQSTITLDEIAHQIHLTPTSFCRYFKERTRKPFMRYLIEYRLAYACKMIASTEGKIQDIAFESGFSNLSHFNDQFKKVVGTTPKEYRARNREKFDLSVTNISQDL